MGGALNLAENWLEGSLLLNLDSEDRGQVYIGCAGGADVEVDAQLPSAATSDHERVIEIALTGLKGGHSGIDIHKPLGNANRLLVRVLRSLEAFDARLISYHGGTLRNAIPREAFAQVALPADELDAAMVAIAGLETILLRELGSGDSGLSISVQPLTEAPEAEPLTLTPALCCWQHSTLLLWGRADERRCPRRGRNLQ